MTNYTTAYVGLGSNLDQPREYIRSAIDALTALSTCKNLSCSQWYQSKAVGPGEQADYINAVVKLDTELNPLAFLHELQSIENQHGRQRHVRWGARTLDLDLLLHGNTVMNSPTLQLPHPEINHRNFVLYPLRDVNPNLIFPNGQSVTAALAPHTMNDLSPITTLNAT